MKKTLKTILKKISSNDIVWSVLKPTLIRFADFAQSAKRADREAFFFRRVLDAVAPDLVVRHGPFKGMVYPPNTSHPRNLVLKTIGSYERELHPLIERICAEKYSEIVDIGCAEGYYAVGLALRLRQATIYAFDTDDQILGYCRKMAALNRVAERIIFGRFCDAQTLLAIPVQRRALVISDCEGYEKTLFTDETISRLTRHDILIEIHDFIDIEISTTLRQRFKPTHSITVIQSLDDIAKAHAYHYDELQSYDLATRRMILAESRPQIMEWFFLSPLAES